MNENIDVQITELRADILATLSEEMATIREEIEEAVSAVIPEPEKDPDEAEKEKNVDGDIIPDTDVDGDAIIDLDDGEENEIIYADYTVEDKLRLDELYDALSGVDLSSLKRAATDIEQAAISEEQELVLDDILASLDALVVSPVENDEKAGLILSILEDEFSTPLEAAPVVIELNQIKEHLRSMAEPLDSSEDDPEGETDTFGPKLVTALETIIGDDDLTVDNINSVAEDFDAAITELVPDEEFRSRLVSIITDEEHQREAYNPRSARLNNIRKRLVEIVGNEDDVVDAMERIDDIIDAFMDTSVVNNIKDSVTALFGEGADPLDVIRDEIPETTPEEVEAEIKLLSEEDTGEETDDTPIDEVVPEESEYDEDEEAHEDAPRTDSDLSTLINAKFQEVAERYDCLITLLNVDQFITDFREEIQNEITEAQFEAVENIIRNRVLENFSYQQIYDINSSIAGTIMDHFAARHIYAETIDTIKLNFKEAAGNTMTLQNLRSQLATFESVTTGLLTTEQMDAAKATIREAVIDKLYVNTLNAKLAIIEHAIIEQADIKYAAIEDLDAATGRIGTLETDMATANTLIAGKANIDLANVNNAWIENGVIKDAAISDAQIHDVSANKLTAGTIDASNITVTNLNADNITVGTLNGQRIGQGSLSLDKLNEAVYTEAEVDAKLNTMQQEIDGAIETFTGDVVPTLNNYPASGWSADDRSKHVGDVYYVVNAGNQADGYCYRFAYDNSTGTYGWVLIKDSDVTAALQRLIDAEGDIDDLEDFQSQTSSWISNTDEELTSIKSNVTSLTTRMSTAEGNITNKVDTSTFNTLSQTVGENSATITMLTETVATKADASDIPTNVSDLTNDTGFITDADVPTKVSDLQNDSGFQTSSDVAEAISGKADSSTVTTLSNTVNNVSQTATSNSSKISQLTQTLGTNADGTTKANDVMHKISDVTQDLDGFKTTVSQTYYLASNPNGYTGDAAANAVAQDLANNYSTTSQMTSAINQSATNITTTVSQTYATKTSVYTKTETDGLLDDKADSSDLTALTGRVTTAESNISQNADNIALKVSATDLYGYYVLDGDDFLEGVVYYEFDGTNYTPTTDTAPEEGKTYYTYETVYTDTIAGRNMQAALELKIDAKNLISEINASADTMKIRSGLIEIDVSKLIIRADQVKSSDRFEVGDTTNTIINYVRFDGTVFESGVTYYEYNESNDTYTATSDTVPGENKTYYYRIPFGSETFYEYIYSVFSGSTFEEGITYYEYIDGKYVKTTDETKQSGKTYYTLSIEPTSDASPQIGKTYYVLADLESITNNIPENISQLTDDIGLATSESVSQVGLVAAEAAGGVSAIQETLATTVQPGLDKVDKTMNEVVVPGLTALQSQLAPISEYKGVFDYISVDNGLNIYGIADKNIQPTKVAVRIKGDRISFTKGNSQNNEIAWIGTEFEGSDDYNLFIQSAQVKKKVQIGTMAFIPRTNGNMSLKFIGD